jgi:hypothetical protein
MWEKDKISIQTLIDEGLIDEEKAEYLRKKNLQKKEKSGSQLLNLIIILGAISIIAGFLGLNPNPHLGAVFAALLLALGYSIYYLSAQKWEFVAKSFSIIGCLGISAWIFFVSSWDGLDAILIPTIIIAVVAYTLSSRFLVALLPVNISLLIDSMAGYFHGGYHISVEQPSLSTVIYLTMCLATYTYIARRNYQKNESKNIKLARIFGRTSFIILNISLWVGSIWGDNLSNSGLTSYVTSDLMFTVPEFVFSIGWAVILMVGIYLGSRSRFGFITNTSIVFMGIHFYTQYFETFGAKPLSLLIGGLLTFSSALIWYQYHEKIVSKINKARIHIGGK